MGRSGKWLGVAVGVVAIVLTTVGFVGPWWNVRVSGSVLGQSFDSNADFRLFGGTATATAGSFSQTNTTDYIEDPNTRNVFLAGAALSGLAIVIGVALVALAAMADRSPTMRRGAAVFGIMAFVLSLASVLYVMSALPSAVNADTGSSGAEVSGFWGTDSIALFGSTFTMTWAAGWAWYTVLVGSILFLVAGILAFSARKAAPMARPPSMEKPPESPPMP